ncbi:MAG: LapA family protein [Betaproteobacteria bacterium]|nr:LapA family protein [Betaproteobacteria bacterium]
MRIFFLLLKTVVFLLLLGFAFKNTDSVAVRYFPGLEWQAPLVFVLLVFVGIGIAVGVMASFVIIVRQRREILGLKRELRSRARPLAAPATAESV